MKNRTIPWDKQYPRVYRAMKRAGHDAATALRILIDAERGDKLTLTWIRTVRNWK